MELDLVQGDRIELTVGAPAHGGHCVARLGGRVVFVRHALPGEEVTAEITEIHKSFLRADAVEIHSPSPDRITPACRYARPGACGGCDLQHVSADAQLRWKGAVVEEQLRRLAGLSLSVRVEALPPSLGWRTRVRYAVDALGRAGLLQHRSHQVVPIERCVIAHPAIQELDLLERVWDSASSVQAVASSGGEVAVLERGPGGGAVEDDPTSSPMGGTLISGPSELTEVAAGRTFGVPPQGFWQVHPAAADTLTASVLDMLRPVEGETAWDLYGGAGLFAAALAGHTRARVTLVESSPVGAAAARANLSDLPVEVVHARVESALRRLHTPAPDLVVLDPPRSGAGARVVREIAAADPRAVAYVACDPASLARDVATFATLGWRLAELRAFDCFPMTHHVECVALLLPA
ncbi:class I SAM-dependent RNA methyltransferase [Actinoplanes sp. TBRC 11911]|nr:class I SAM-dependent RNA methyltransferase [Actinoplanes sp. TBRC 11911]